MKCSECGKDIPPIEQRTVRLGGEDVPVNVCDDCIEKGRLKLKEYKPEKGGTQ
jgi:hypothetical protein